jgi:hypothetical protein
MGPRACLNAVEKPFWLTVQNCSCCSHRLLIPGRGEDVFWSKVNFVRFEALMAVTMKSNCMFWYVTPCSLVEIYRRFGRIYCL